ncbi:MAG TPA: hypothetical protein ENJ22_04650 [Gammaproteobacteria bacterium]|nr:hypothetical protein [Gammaproteobacteria bacterium]
MADDPVRYAYLEAGVKSSAVALDPRLETGRPETVWLYNLARGEFVEYRRDIVEGKLREFNDGEQALRKQLESAFAVARAAFRPRPMPFTSTQTAPRKSATPPVADPLPEEVEELPLDMDDEDLATAEDPDEELE